MPLGEPQPFYRDRRLLAWLGALLVIEIVVGSKLVGRATLVFNLAILLVTPLLVVAISAIRSRRGLPNAPASARRSLRRPVISVLTFVGILPIAVTLTLSDSKHDGRFFLDVFATDILIGGGIGFAAMVCSFIVAAVPEERWSKRLMTFGIDLAFWALASILLYGVVAGVPPQ